MAEFCKKCNTGLNGAFCSGCGQKAQLERINGSYIKHEIEHLFHFEKGFLYTIRELLVRPGKNVRDFLAVNRSGLVKPITFIIITSLIYTLVNQYFHIEEQYVQFDETKTTTTGLIFKWITDHYGYANILMSVFIVFFIRLFFKKYDYNFYEILILICYVMGIGMLITALFALLQGLIHFGFMQLAGILFLAYTTFAIADFYDRRKPINYVKAFSAYFLGMMIFYTSAVIIGTVIDHLKNT